MLGGTEREQSMKLLTGTGFGVLTRPDGGVVTQRTANPLPRAGFRDSSHNSPSVPCISFQGLSGLSANAAQGIEAGTDETPTAAQPEGREPGPKDAHNIVPTPPHPNRRCL
jgi:hypothetical protein